MSLELLNSEGSVTGDIFEAKDCELVSIHATKIGEGSLSKLNFSNKDLAFISINLNAAGANLVLTPPYPSTRFYCPTLEEAEATLAVALLFKEI